MRVVALINCAATKCVCKMCHCEVHLVSKSIRRSSRLQNIKSKVPKKGIISFSCGKKREMSAEPLNLDSFLQFCSNLLNFRNRSIIVMFFFLRL